MRDPALVYLSTIQLHVLLLYILVVLVSIAAVVLWIAQRKQSRLHGEHLSELGITFEGKCQLWEERQQAFELSMQELSAARDQQETLLTRSISNRSMRKEAMGQLRAGARPDAVSAKLELPRSEVRLLAAVQSILADSLSS